MNVKIINGGGEIVWGSQDVIEDVRTFLPRIPENSVAAIYTSHFLEHLPGSDVVEVLKHCYRVLKKDGVFEIIVPNFLCYLRHYIDNDQVFWEGRKKDKALTHQIIRGQSVEQPIQTMDLFFMSAIFLAGAHRFAFTPDSLRYLLNQAGFANIHFKTQAQDLQIEVEIYK
jgi:predicted SAM-dependent methyltransferase